MRILVLIVCPHVTIREQVGLYIAFHKILYWGVFSK
jgi:hypothetical protein